MAKRCSLCGRKIRLHESRETIGDQLYCDDCAARRREEKRQRQIAEEEGLQAVRQRVVQAVREELTRPSREQDDPAFTRKLNSLHSLVGRGVLTAAEFNTLKKSLMRHWAWPDEPQGRFGVMYEAAKGIISKALVAPATAKFPLLEESMIVFEGCEPNQFLISSYVDSQARSSALLRSRYRAKFDLNTGTLLGVSLFQDLNPPYQNMGWGPYVLL